MTKETGAVAAEQRVASLKSTPTLPEESRGPDASDDTEDMAAVGRSLMASIDALLKSDRRFKHWAPAQDPAEIVFDVVNMLDESNDHVLRLQTALLLVRGIIKDGALAGFNPLDGDWAERLFASQGTTKNALSPLTTTAAVDTAKGGEDGNPILKYVLRLIEGGRGEIETQRDLSLARAELKQLIQSHRAAAGREGVISELRAALEPFAKPHAFGDSYVRFAPRLIEAARVALKKGQS